MQAASAWSIDPRPQNAVHATVTQLFDRLGGRPDFVVAQHTVTLPAAAIATALATALPGVPIHGSTSCQGIMTEEGYRGGPTVLGLFGLRDPGGAFGTAASELHDDPEAAAMSAAEQALIMANRPGERPDLIWITGAPGCEERLISGLGRMFGSGVPIAGGSSADDDITGGWNQFAGSDVHRTGVVVSTLFPSKGVSFSFHSGYDPTPIRARITAARGRTIATLDGQPAAHVYDTWTGGILGPSLRNGGSVLAKTTLYPLGRRACEVGGVPYYQLSHPESVSSDSGLTVFTDVAVGEEIILMRGSRETLVSRAGRATRSAVEACACPPAGALMIYCAGCMLTVQEYMSQVVDSVRGALPTQPFLGGFTFGEQGCLPGGENRHGNLMIVAVVFPS